MVGRIHARMTAEGYVSIQVADFDAKTHGEGVFWAWTAWEGNRTGFRRMAVARTSRPRWSRYISIYGPTGGDFATGLLDAPIYVRPQ